MNCHDPSFVKIPLWYSWNKIKNTIQNIYESLIMGLVYDSIPTSFSQLWPKAPHNSQIQQITLNICQFSCSWKRLCETKKEPQSHGCHLEWGGTTIIVIFLAFYGRKNQPSNLESAFGTTCLFKGGSWGKVQIAVCKIIQRGPQLKWQIIDIFRPSLETMGAVA